jgi:hypothetical protein
MRKTWNKTGMVVCTLMGISGFAFAEESKQNVQGKEQQCVCQSTTQQTQATKEQTAKEKTPKENVAKSSGGTSVRDL